MNWTKIEFKDFITLQRGFDLPLDKIVEGDVPVYGSKSIIGYHNAAKVAGPGVITGRSGTLGVVQYTDEPYWPHNTSLWVKEFNGNHPKYVYYKLKTLNLGAFGGGASVPTLNRNNLDNLIVSVHPFKTQQRIASILSNYDDRIENNRKRITLLEESAREIYKEWFVRLRFPGYERKKINNGLPEGWELKKIGEVSETIGGGTPSTTNPAYWDGGSIIWIIPSDITRNSCLVLLDSEKKITEEGYRNSSAKMLPPETILMTSRASVGFFGLIDKEVCTNQGFISVIPHNNNYRMYFLHNLMSRRDEILAKAGGATYKEINKSTFREFSILIPSEPLAIRFNRFAYDTVKQTRLLHKENARLSEARDILLPKLMSGELKV